MTLLNNLLKIFIYYILVGVNNLMNDLDKEKLNSKLEILYMMLLSPFVILIGLLVILTMDEDDDIDKIY